MCWFMRNVRVPFRENKKCRRFRNLARTLRTTPRKHPPVSGGKRPLCTLGVAPGQSRGIGGCARAPCVSLAPAEGTARGCAGMWRGKPVLLRNRWSCPGPGSASAPGPASESETGFGAQNAICRYPHFSASAADALQDSRGGSARVCHDRGAGLSPCARNTIRVAISRDTPSNQHAGHAVRRNRTRSAAGTFSGHRQRSRRICHQKCGWPTLSDDEPLVEEHARLRGVGAAP